MELKNEVLRIGQYYSLLSNTNCVWCSFRSAARHYFRGEEGGGLEYK